MANRPVSLRRGGPFRVLGPLVRHGVVPKPPSKDRDSNEMTRDRDEGRRLAAPNADDHALAHQAQELAVGPLAEPGEIKITTRAAVAHQTVMP